MLLRKGFRRYGEKVVLSGPFVSLFKFSTPPLFFICTVTSSLTPVISVGFFMISFVNKIKVW